MSTAVMVVDGVGKCYLRFSSEWRRIARWLDFATQPDSERWVLRDVSFRVDRGEAVAIIGQNGAGKSTLLRMITGTCQATEGRITVSGRVSAMLELGLGFNPELTGRQNVLHVAGMQGISHAQALELMPEIEAFAEVGEYFDQPVRTYSSGMQMRVAFSVATAIRPDILIIDEALAVGDAYFVHKSFQRIRDFREAGTTLLFVSHDPSAVRLLCDRAVLLDSGRLVMEGDPSEVLDYYNALIADRETSTITTDRSEAGSVRTQSGTGEADFEGLAIVDGDGRPVEIVRVGEFIHLRARVRVHESMDSLVFGYMIRDRLGEPVHGTNTHHTEQILTAVSAGETIEFDVRIGANIGPGSYSVSVALHADDSHIRRNFRWQDHALMFSVVNFEHPLFVGTAWLPVSIAIQRTAKPSQTDETDPA